jgi:hypothetical protein
MAESRDVSLEHFRTLAEHAGLTLTDAELTDLKPMYAHYAALVQSLHDVELGVEDLAVTFIPDWPTYAAHDTP